MSPDISHIVLNAKQIITNIIWPDGPTCPHCGSKDYYVCKDSRYICKHCHKKYSIKLGTLFEHSHIPLSKWLIALYLMLVNNGLSSISLSHYINVTQPTAYKMMIRLRFLFAQDYTRLSGSNVAIDEEYVGGSWAKFTLQKRLELLNKFKLPKCPKTIKEKLSIANKVNSLYKIPVLGINDGTSIVLRVLSKPVSKDEVVSIFKKHIEPDSHTVSDCSKLYDDWEALTGSKISYNNHSKGQFKTPDGKSSNRVEGTFSQWKRQSLNLHCHLSKRLLQLYLDTFAFRFNHRHLSVLERISEALKNVRQKVTSEMIASYDSLFGKSDNIEIFDPYIFFKKNTLFKEVTVDNVVYRREEFMHA